MGNEQRFEQAARKLARLSKPALLEALRHAGNDYPNLRYWKHYAMQAMETSSE